MVIIGAFLFGLACAVVVVLLFALFRMVCMAWRVARAVVKRESIGDAVRGSYKGFGTWA